MGYSVLRGRQSDREKCMTSTGAGCAQQASASAPIKVKQRVAYRHRRCITRAGVGRHRVGGRLGGRVAHTVQVQNRSTLWSSLLHSTLATVLHVGSLAHARHEERRWFVTRATSHPVRASESVIACRSLARTRASGLAGEMRVSRRAAKSGAAARHCFFIAAASAALAASSAAAAALTAAVMGSSSAGVYT